MRTAAAVLPARSRATDFVALTKPRLNLLVVATTAAGYYLGAGRASTTGALLHVVVRHRARRRRVGRLQSAARTARGRADGAHAHRPVADGRLSPRETLVFATVLSALGLAWLALAANVLAAAVAAATLVTYVLLYTPLKLRTSFATVIGAIPGRCRR